MPDFRDSLHRLVAVCLAIAGALSALYGLALLATALTGNSSPSSILLGGFGFILMILSVPLLIFAIKKWTSTKPGKCN
jgi:hypothetical protein